MPNITGIAMELGVPAAIGAVSQLVENYDAKKEVEFAALPANVGKKFSEIKKIGTWVSFGVPVLGIVAQMTNIIPIPREWADRMVSAGGVLAGQKVVQMLTKKHYHLVYSSAGYTGLAPSLRGGRSFAGGPSQWAPASRGASEYSVLNSTDIMV